MLLHFSVLTININDIDEVPTIINLPDNVDVFENTTGLFKD